MSANIKASVDGTRAIIGVGGVDQMTVSNAGVVTANSFVGAMSGNASSATALATGSTTARTLANRFADVVNVKDFGAVGDGVTDDRIAIINAISAAKSAGGGTIVFPEGTYLISGTQGTYSVSELQSNYQYSNSSYSAQIYVNNADNLSFVFDGAVINSSKTDGGYTFVFDGCSNLSFENLTMTGATVMSGSTAVVLGTSAISVWSNTANSSNISFHNTKISNHYGSVDFAGDPYSAFNASNISFSGYTSLSNGYYGISCRGNGRELTITNGYSYRQNRPFFIYDTLNININMVADEINGGFQALVKTYTYPTRNIRLKFISKNKANVVTPRLAFQSQHNTAIQPTPSYLTNIYTDYSDFNDGNGGDGIDFSYYQNSTLQNSTNQIIFNNFIFVGSCSNNLTTSTLLTSNNNICLLDVTNFLCNNNYQILDGTGFVGANKLTSNSTLSFGDLSVGITYDIQETEYYVKNGMCYVFGKIKLTSKGSSTGYASLTLPLKSREAASRSAIITMQFEENFSGITSPVTGYLITSDDTRVRLRFQNSTGTSPVTDANFTNTSNLMFNIIYPI